MTEIRQDSSTDDDELDMTSEKFNPLKALYSNKVKLPRNQRKFDNLSSFCQQVKLAGSLDSDLGKVASQRTKKDQQTEAVDQEKFHVTAAGRKFLKSQAPIHRGKKAKLTRDIFIRMENSKGPIELLKKFRGNKTRVKVYTRKEHGIRGFVTGFVVAFDKHFNIALIDCIEVWTRRKFKFSENNVPILGCPEDCSEHLKAMGIQIPEISTKSVDRKRVQCTRKLPQIVIRGEEVVLVAEDKEEVNQRLDLMKL